MISAIVLAAGESKRMGQPKQLLPFGRSTILAETIANLLASAADEVIVVLGHRAQAIKKTVTAAGVKIVINPDYRLGMSTAIIAGLSMIDRRAEAVMLVLGDQPAIDSQTINRLIAGFRARNTGIAVPTYRGQRGHPVILAISYKPEMMALRGDVGAREIIRRHPDAVLEVAVTSPGVVADIDTGDDYRALAG